MKIHKYTAALVITLSSLLWACSVSKDVVLPASTVPLSFRNSDAVDSVSIAGLSIQDFFLESELRELIDTALAKNSDIQVALKNIESAELLFKQSKLGNTPAAILQVTANSNRPSDNSLNGLSASQFLSTTHVEDFNANLAMVWEADIWGRIKREKQVALATFLQTTEAKKAIQTRLISNVAQGYYRLLMLDAQLAVAKRSLALSDSTLAIIKLQFDAGQVTSLGIQQAEAQQLLAAQLIPQFEQNIEVQENALQVLTGNMPRSVSRLDRLDKIQLSGLLPTGIPSIMLSRRPDVKSAELSLNIANARVGIAKAGLYPTLSVTAGTGLNSFRASDWFNIPASLFGTVAGGITQPLLQRKSLKTKYELAKIDREKVVIMFRQSVLNAVSEVSDELVKSQKLKAQYDISVQRARTLQQAVRNSNLLFKNGMANYLEVIVAQNNLMQSELELAVIKTARLSASVELYRSLGGGYN